MINTLKYLVYAMTIYVLFSFVPKKRVCLADLMLIITLIISLNFAYEFMENNKNPLTEGYDPFNNDKQYSINLDEINDDFDQNKSLENISNNEDTISKNNPTKINPKLETKKPNIIGNLTELSKESIPPTGVDNDTQTFASTKPIENKDDENKDDENKDDENKDDENKDDVSIQALDTSNSSNLASLELAPEDEDKKEKIQYIKKEEFNQFKYGYSYMDTKYWDLPVNRTPVCKNIKPCKVCPRQTSGFDKDRMEWK